MPAPRLKICGLTQRADAELVLRSGVEYLGFNFFSGSKRALTLDDLDWIAKLPRASFSEASFVAVVVNPAPPLLAALEESALFSFIQFHGDELPEDCARCRLPWIKAAPVLSQAQLESLLHYPTDHLLLDAPAAPGQYGGTGNQANWSLAAEFIVAHPEKQVFLAGGITPENAARAAAAVRPFALDLASGVEIHPRQKDPQKLAALLSSLGRLASPF